MSARRDPVRTAAVLAPALVAAVLVPFLVREAYRTVTTSTQGRAEPTAPRVARLPDTPALLVVLDDERRMPAAAVLVAVSPSGAGGAVVLLPLGTQTTGPTGQPERLDAPAATAGLDGIAANVEGLLGITLAGRARLSPDELAGLLGPLTPVAIDASGPSTASEVATLLTLVGDEREVERVRRAAAVWRALLPESPRGLAGSPPAPGPIGAALVALAAGRTVVRPLPVTDVEAPDERYLADEPWLRLLMAEIVPAAVSPADANLRLRILNPSGDESIAYVAVSRLLGAGGNIVLVDSTAGAVPATSAATLADDTRRTELAELLAGLGQVSVATTDERIDGIDATVTLGQDLVTMARNANASSTTVATPTTLVASSTSAATTTTMKKTP